MFRVKVVLTYFAMNAIDSIHEFDTREEAEKHAADFVKRNKPTKWERWETSVVEVPGKERAVS